MDELSFLIKEAKPLYLEKKYRNLRLKKMFTLIFAAGILALSIFAGYKTGTDFAQNQNGKESAFASSSTLYPVDEYGLVMVE